MFRLNWIIIGLWSFSALAIPCDCEVRVHTPLTASHSIPYRVIQTYHLEEFSTFAKKNIRQCRESCLKEFQKDMRADRLAALLLTYGQELIDSKMMGYNCTGLTSLKFPVRVRAKLGPYGLGNVADLVQVVSHEEQCF